MHKHLTLLTTLGLALAALLPVSEAQADDHSHQVPLCGGLKLHRWEWSPWFRIGTENGVQADVRYRMKFAGYEKVKTHLQIRYANFTSSSKEASVYDGQLHFHDGRDGFWEGETVALVPNEVALGEVHILDGRLCSWTKNYSVR